jgi:hypothetical protein
VRRDRRGERAAGAAHGPRVDALAAQPTEARAAALAQREEIIGRTVAFAPSPATRADAAASTPSSLETSQPVSSAASGRFGVTKVQRETRSWSVPKARRSSSGVPSDAASTGSITIGMCRDTSSSRKPSSTLRATSSVASMPSFTASGCTSRSSTRSCASTTFGNTGSTS